MKHLAVIFLVYCNLIQAQDNDIFSDEFIKERVNEINSAPGNMISYSYTPEFKTILKELLKLSWIEDAINISDYYFPLFESKLKKYDLPEDLKYLPILESGLNPKATSIVGASGLWQFMEGTGDMMGLQSNEYINLYYCPVANTDSACRYLESLYTEFGDWKMVLSSYNYGIGNVRKKTKIAGSKQYSDIYPYLPLETRAYVPKFLVIKYLVTYKDIYFSSGRKFKYVFSDLRQIKIEKQTTLKTLAQELKQNENFLRFANPQLLSNIIPSGTIIYIN